MTNFVQRSIMKVYNNILETIGNTPLVRINKLAKQIPALVLAKIETTNPGNSVKDRMAVKMIEDAEKAGILKPGSTVIEGTSGNTGMGLALACIIKGYKLICVLNDKQSKEKMDILRAVGAEACPRRCMRCGSGRLDKLRRTLDVAGAAASSSDFERPNRRQGARVCAG